MPTLGVLGFAHGHVDMYLARWRQMDDVRVAAGWDRDGERLARACGQYGLEAMPDVASLLKRSDIDAVVICAETAFHADLAVQAAEAGKTIILQKPMALTLAEADRIVAAVESNGVPFTMAWQMRVDPQNLEIKRVVESGQLGKIFMARRRHGLATHTWPGGFENMWHADPALNRDIWADDAAHPIDFLYWLFGEPETVTAELATLHNPKVPMDNGIAIFRYPGGPLAEVVCSFTCLAGENTTEIIGEHGVLIQNYGDGPSCGVPRRADAPGLKWYLRATGQWIESEVASPASHGERIAGLARPLADFVLGRRPPLATAREGRTALRLTLACYAAHETGRRIRIADLG